MGARNEVYEAGIEMPSAAGSERGQLGAQAPPARLCRRQRERGRTLEGAHDAVEAFWAELIVAKAAEELRDDDVGLVLGVEAAHVRVDELDLAAPLERRALLQAVCAQRERASQPSRPRGERPSASRRGRT